MATLKTPLKAARKPAARKPSPAKRQARKPSTRLPGQSTDAFVASEIAAKRRGDFRPAFPPVPRERAYPPYSHTDSSRLALVRDLQIDAFCPAQQAEIDLGGGTLAHVLVLGEHTTDTGPVFACLPIDVSPTRENVQWRTRDDIIWAKRPSVADGPAPELTLEPLIRDLEKQWAQPAAVATRAQVMRDKIMAAGIAVQRYDAAKRELRVAAEHLSERSADVAAAEHVINSGKFDELCRRMLLADVILRHRLQALT